MSNLKEKASQNILAAELLLKNYHYASSIHCSFYSCVQNILHTLFYKLGKDQVQFQADLKNAFSGTHAWSSKVIGIELAKININEYKKFQKEFPEIKALREKADYSNETIKQEEGYDAFNKSNSINTTLRKAFK